MTAALQDNRQALIESLSPNSWWANQYQEDRALESVGLQTMSEMYLRASNPPRQTATETLIMERHIQARMAAFNRDLTQSLWESFGRIGPATRVGRARPLLDAHDDDWLCESCRQCGPFLDLQEHLDHCAGPLVQTTDVPFVNVEHATDWMAQFRRVAQNQTDLRHYL